MFTLATAAELGVSGRNGSVFADWKMQRASDGAWYARDADGGRWVSAAGGSLPAGYDYALIRDGGRLLSAAEPGSGVNLYAQFKLRCYSRY